MYLGFKEFGDGAVLFGVLGQLFKLFAGDIGYAGFQGKVRCGDGAFFEDDLAFRFDFGGCEAGALQVEGQFHGEAAGMGGSHQLFGVGSGAALKPGEVAVRGLVEDTALCRDRPVTGFAGSVPYSGRFAFDSHSDFCLAINITLPV